MLRIAAPWVEAARQVGQMKKALAVLVMAVGMLSLSGCQKTVAAPAPPLVDQINTFDGDTYRSLILVQASLDSLKADIAKNSQLAYLQPSVDQAGQQYNVAMLAWKTYHAAATAANQQAAAQALARVQASVKTLSTQVPK
jgi:hypothetical protein